MKIICFYLHLLTITFCNCQDLPNSWKGITQMQESKWHTSPEAKAIADRVLLYQSSIGGWPKNIEMQKPLDEYAKRNLLDQKNNLEAVTIDNGATTQEMLFLSKIYRQTSIKRYKNAFLLGLNYLLKAQYKNGGWPQFYPLREGYYSHITYNDDAMVNVLFLLKGIIDQPHLYTIPPSSPLLKAIQEAFEKGIACILATQYRQNGVLTSWCAQYDENTLKPAKARSYELPSLSGKESAKIVLLLMSLQHPSPQVIEAVTSATVWFEKTKITHLKENRILDNTGKIIEKKMIDTVNASPLWARFMDLDDNTPFFCDRDGIKKTTLEALSKERQNGYMWYTSEPKEVLEKYPIWLRNNSTSPELKNTKKENYVTVDATGAGDYTQIQEAINSARSYPDERITIFIKNGTYHEKVKIHAWNTKITLIGEDKAKTVITFDDHFKKINVGRNSTFHTYTVLVEGADFIAQNLTIANASGEIGQAVALHINSNRVKIVNCNLIGNQDTLYTSGEGAKNYIKDCYIEGTTDFIFGDATVYFENCVINSKKDSYITAASTPINVPFGYVFKNCKLTSPDTITAVYLGRPWRSYAKTVYINCEMGKHILPEGWDNWSKKEAETTSFYAEYNCSGAGFQPQKRVPWSHQLSKKEAKKYTIAAILNDPYHKNWYDLTITP